MVEIKAIKRLRSVTFLHVTGTAPSDNPGGTFAFALVWRNGTSTTVWTAQCLECGDGHETLFTSWLERSKVDTRKEKEGSTRIGQDTFTRYEQSNGPTKINDSNSGATPTVRKTIKNWDPDVKSKPCNLNGNWYNQLGSETILTQKDDSIVEGEYRTAVERKPGSAGNSFSKVLGIGQLGGPSSAFPFMVLWRNGGSVTGWLAQCYINGENKTEIIETAWLLRAKIDKCIDNWKSTFYGQDTFTHTEQRAGPRKKDGTDVPDRGQSGTKKKSASGSPLLLSLILLSLALFNCLAQLFN